MSDFQRKWETYKGFRIEPFLMQFTDKGTYKDPETSGKWTASVEIKLADGKPVKPFIDVRINVEGEYASCEAAYLAAVKRGEEEIDNATPG